VLLQIKPAASFGENFVFRHRVDELNRVRVPTPRIPKRARVGTRIQQRREPLICTTGLTTETSPRRTPDLYHSHFMPAVTRAAKLGQLIPAVSRAGHFPSCFFVSPCTFATTTFNSCTCVFCCSTIRNSFDHVYLVPSASTHVMCGICAWPPAAPPVLGRGWVHGSPLAPVVSFWAHLG
jgi:hypothetical protein